MLSASEKETFLLCHACKSRVWQRAATATATATAVAAATTVTITAAAVAAVVTEVRVIPNRAA